MPQWRVAGANKKTGEEVVWSIEAATGADAETTASGMGLMVSEITPLLDYAPREAPARAKNLPQAVWRFFKVLGPGPTIFLAILCVLPICTLLNEREGARILLATVVSGAVAWVVLRIMMDRPAQPKDMTIGEDATWMVFSVAGLLLIISYAMDSSTALPFVPSFKTDNAVGATANFVAELKIQAAVAHRELMAGIRAIGGLLFWILASLIKLRAAMRARS